jgi:Mrp family chromosome partitioning ATPase
VPLQRAHPIYELSKKMVEPHISEITPPGDGMAGQPPFATRPLGPRGPITFYEAFAFDTMRSLWRKKYMLASFVAAGLVIAMLVIATAAKMYTATATIQFDFARMEATKFAPPSATMDAAVLVEGQAQILRSAALARRVVGRLKLDQDPDYTSSGPVGSILDILRGRADGATSNVERAAQRLARQLTVTNNGRTYLVTISMVAGSPERAALLANTYLSEYVKDHVLQRIREAEAAARSALADARSAYGERHPTIIQAKAALSAAEERLRAQENSNAELSDDLPRVAGQTFLKAEPEWLPSGPNPFAVLGLGLIVPLLGGIAFVLFQEHRDTGFRTEQGVPAELGVRCVGMIPRAADKFSADRKPERREALRSLCLSVGLTGDSAAGIVASHGGNSRVVMISSALPNVRKRDFIHDLRRSLVEEGTRVLVIDASPASHAGNSIGLDDALESIECLQEFFIDESGNSDSELCRKAGLNGARNPFASFAYAGRSFERLLSEAKAHYGVIIVDAPPVLLLADSIFLGRYADISLLVANWNETPRATVAEAVHRLTENGVRVDGIVLTEVDLGSYASFATGDRTYHLSRYQDTFRPPPQNPPLTGREFGE